MPEEINRLVTDQISNLLFTPSEDGNHNLAREGVSRDKVFFVGNVMIDTLIRLLPKARSTPVPPLAESIDRFGLVTLHRPSNVDDPSALDTLLESLTQVSESLPLVFPVHPRTRQRLDASRQDLPGRL